MNAVGLVERRVTGDALQQERDEAHLVSLREIAIDLAKRRRVIEAVVRRRFHPREDDRDVARLARDRAPP